MDLRFLCPNGHKIHCPVNRAGRAAKCPKCGVKFQIPDASDVEAGGSGDSLLAISDSGPSVPLGGTARRPQPEQQIEFLCPNGHLLHGPASMQGRPGQCPDCGAKFRVPTYDEDEDEIAEEEEPLAGPSELEIEVVEDSPGRAEPAVQNAAKPDKQLGRRRSSSPSSGQRGPRARKWICT
jgi:hypothetical protein